MDEYFEGVLFVGQSKQYNELRYIESLYRNTKRYGTIFKSWTILIAGRLEKWEQAYSFIATQKKKFSVNIRGIVSHK